MKPPLLTKRKDYHCLSLKNQLSYYWLLCNRLVGLHILEDEMNLNLLSRLPLNSRLNFQKNKSMYGAIQIDIVNAHVSE